LNDLFPGIAHPINVGESPHDSEKYANLKAELYWGLRMRAQAGDLIGYLDEKLVGQLAGIRYKHNARGQIVIESKEEARKRGVKSPDRAEAVMLAFAQHELPYGLTTYLQDEQAKIDSAQLDRLRATAEKFNNVAPGVGSGPVRGDSVSEQAKNPTGGCPLCGALCIASVCSGGLRCNNCGYQWGKQAPSTDPFNRAWALRDR